MLNQLRDSQLSIHYVSPATHTTELINQTTAKLNAALSESQNADSNTMLAQYRDEIVYIVSIGLGLMSVAMTLALFHLERENGCRNEPKQDKTNAVSRPVSSSLVVEVECNTKPIDTEVVIPETAFVAATTH